MSKRFWLNAKDFFKGLIVAIITAVLTFAVNELQTGSEMNETFWKRCLLSSGIAFLSYLLKNLFTNSEGKFKPEPNEQA